MSLPSWCGCFNYTTVNNRASAQFLPQVDLKVHSTILASTSRTTLSQTFINPSSDVLKDVRYTLPLYEGVSVVAFKCEVGDRVIHGLVKPRAEAKAEYDEAVAQGKAAALLQQAQYTSEVFTTAIGNVPQTSKVVVEITYLGTLQHDAEADGLRFTIPVDIAPRYVSRRNVTKLEVPNELDNDLAPVVKNGRINITADILVDKASTIRGIQSPSHPVSVSLGQLSTSKTDSFEKNCASAALTMEAGNVLFDNDFVLIVQATEQDVPVAYLETHPSIPNQRAIMATLVPKFNIPSASPEIVFVIDRSGSMDTKIDTLKSALRVFLKSLPVGTVFNICSFGSSYSFLWEKSKVYDRSILKEAMKFVEKIAADMGGTEIQEPITAAVSNRFKDMELEVLLLTDGQIFGQKHLFEYIKATVAHNPIRFFSLGIGEAVSHSLINGIARAGRGFAQSVGTNEQLEKKVVRMLKGALTPHIDDYRVDIEFEPDDVEEEYDMVESADDIPMATDPPPAYQDTGEKTDLDSKQVEPESKPPIPLYDPSFKESEIGKAMPEKERELINLPVPKVLQVPHKLPTLYPFSRTDVYFLLSPDSCQKTPRYIVINATSVHGPLTLRVPIEHVGQGASIHQLAARALCHELEEGRGWIFHAKDKKGEVIVEQHESKKEQLVKREATRLCVQFQVSGEQCSFIAVESEKRPDDSEHARAKKDEYAFAPQTEPPSTSETQRHRLLTMFPYAGQLRGGGSNTDTYDPTIEDTDMGRYDPTIRDDDEYMERLRIIAENPPINAHRGKQRKLALASPLFTSFGMAGRKFKETSANFRSATSEILKGKKKTGPSGSGESTPASTKSTTGSKEAVGNKEATNSKNIHAVIALQTFEGSWNWEKGLFGTVNFNEQDLEKKLDWSSILGTESDVGDVGQKTVIATLATVAYLHKKCSGDAETWELVADKAMNWVRTKLDEMSGNSARDNKEILALFDSLF